MPIIKSTNYNIHIENAEFKELNTFLLKNSYSKYIIICDENSSNYCLSKLLFACKTLTTAEIIELESGEKNKTLETCIQVWGALTDIGADKKSIIINLGGGVITDLGGFVASTFKRGIDFINIPTTLLCMVDASVGGKTGVDFEGIKNHIGTTQQPKGVFVNSDFLNTLSEKQIKNGFAEMIKIALIADVDFWKLILKLKTRLDFCTEKIIARAIELKNTIVKKDPFEKNLRKSLNFGHTVGHALESAFLKQNKLILHGEAVAYGILIEAEIALSLKKITKKEFKEIETYLNSIYKPLKLSSSTKKMMNEFMLHDKKNENGNVCFALPNSLGNFELSYFSDLEAIKSVLLKY